MDYSKWNKFDDSDDDVGKQDENSILQNCHILKIRADEFFMQGESRGDTYYYKLAIMEYETALPRLEGVASVEPKIRDIVQQLINSSKLNVACAMSKISKWPEAVQRCDDVIKSPNIASLKDEQILRARYIRAHCCLQMDSEAAFNKAAADVDEMKKMLSACGEKIEKSHVDDYCQLFIDFDVAKQSPQRLEGYQKAAQPPAALASELHLQAMAKVKDGWEQLRAKKSLDAAETFRKIVMSPAFASFTRTDKSNVFFGLAHACAALGDGDKAALAYESAGEQCDVAEEKAALSLRAASLRFKQRKYDAAVVAYIAAENCLTCVEVTEGPRVVELDTTAPTDVSDPPSKMSLGAEGYRAQLVLALARAGRGACLVQLRDCRGATEPLIKASTFFEEHIHKILDEIAAGPEISDKDGGDTISASDGPMAEIDATLNRYGREGGSQKLDAASRAQGMSRAGLYVESTHALNAMESLTDACVGSSQVREAAMSCERAIRVSERILDVGWGVKFNENGQIVLPKGYDATKRDVQGREGDTGASEEGHDLDMLRRRRACMLLAKGHILRSASQQGLLGNQPVEGVIAFWGLAAAELSALGDAKQAQAAFRGVGKAWASLAGVEPFQFVVIGGIDPEASEEAYTGYRNSARESRRLGDRLVLDRRDLQSRERVQTEKMIDLVTEELRNLQQTMQMEFEAGVCALHFDLEKAISSFEAAKSAQALYSTSSTLLSELTTTPDEEEEEREENAAYVTACGDINFHLGQAYSMTGKAVYAEEEARTCVSRFENCTDRRRRKLAAGLLAQALAAQGRDHEAEAALAQIRRICVGPSEDAEKELEDVRKMIRRNRRVAEANAQNSPTSTLGMLKNVVTASLSSGNVKTDKDKKDTPPTLIGRILDFFGAKPLPKFKPGMSQDDLMSKIRQYEREQDQNQHATYNKIMSTSILVCFAAAIFTLISAYRTGRLGI